MAALGLLGACASPPPPAPPSAGGWSAVLLPGKTATVYRAEVKDGRSAIAARADRSASLWRRKLGVPRQPLGEVEFSWWVPHLLPEPDPTLTQQTDAPVRVLFAFTGDMSRLSLRNRSQFELMQLLTGEMPPYATLMYVWDASAPVGTVGVNAGNDRIRKIVVESGAANLGRWRHYRRNLAADFRLAFGEEPGALTSVAVMTDADNTQSQAEAWYGEIKFD